GLCHRCLQRRLQYRRDRGPAAGAMAGPDLGLAHRVRGHRPGRTGVAGVLAAGLSPPGRTPQGVSGGTGADQQRPARSAGPDVVAEPAAVPPDLGVHRRQVPQRLGLVVLPVLVPDVHGRPLRRGSAHDRPADGHRVPAGRRGIGGRRLVQLVPDEARLERERRTQDRDADLRAVHPAGGARAARAGPVGRGMVDRAGRRRAPGMLREPVPGHLRHVPACRGRLGGRHRRLRRRDGRLLHEPGRRLAAAVHRQLCGDVHHGRWRLPGGAAGDPPAGAAPGAGATRTADLSRAPAPRPPDPIRAALRGADTRTVPPMRPPIRFVLAPLLCLLAVLPAAAAPATDCRSPAAVCESRSGGALALIDRGSPVPVLVEADDFVAVRRAAEALRSDLAAVSGGTAPEGEARISIIAGTLGRSARIDRIVRAHGIDTDGVAGTWEAYLLQVVERPEPGIDRALVVVGADRRGTAFGLYEISRRIGVSPWTWWADVPPPRRSALYVAPGRFVDAPK